MIAARIWTHILTTRPSEHKSDALDRSATAPQLQDFLLQFVISVHKNVNAFVQFSHAWGYNRGQMFCFKMRKYKLKQADAEG